MHIRDWPEAERPREKLLAHGAGSLSDAELLAIFLGSGLPGRDAVQTARDLLARHYDPGYATSTRRNFAQFDQALVAPLTDRSPPALAQAARAILQSDSAALASA